MKFHLIFYTIAYLIGLALFSSLSLSIQFVKYLIPFFLLSFGSTFIIKERIREFRPHLLPKHSRSMFALSSLALSAISLAGILFIINTDNTSPDHIANYIREDTEAEITGIVASDPDTKFTFKPETIEYFGSDKKYRIKKGFLQVEIKQGAMELDYNDKLELTGEIEPFATANNPGIFDLNKYYRNRNIFGVVKIRNDYNIRKIKKGSPDFIWNIKRKIIMVMKKTLKYPVSAFLGSVVFGLRSGLPYKLNEEFIITGIGHILSVSGLHCGFIVFLFAIFFKILGVNKKISAVFNIILLLFYTLLIGAAPPIVRSAIMFSIFLITSSFTNLGFRHSLVTSLFISGLAYLLYNPLMFSDASFVMSYTAILSIGILQKPILDFMNAYIKNFMLAAFILFFVFFALFCSSRYFNPNLPEYGAAFKAVSMILFIFAFYMNKKFPNFKFTLGKYLSNFIALQFAVTIGNVLPVSALYFQHFSIASIYTNFFAIPVTGLLVQSGFIASVFGFISIKLALVLNAANYMISKIFLWSIHTIAGIFPYPVMPKPSIAILAVYYGLIFVILKLDPKKIHTFVIKTMGYKELVVRSVIILFLFFVMVISAFHGPRDLKITFIDTRVLGRYADGDCALIETPRGKVVLVNAGPSEFKFKNFVLPIDTGKMNLSPVLSAKRITKIDTILVTDISTEKISALNYILNNFHVDKICMPSPVRELTEIADKHAIPVSIYKSSETIELDPETKLKVLAKDDNSAFLNLNYKNRNVIFSGPLSAKMISELLLNDAKLTADVFQIPGYGASVSNPRALIDKIDAKVCVLYTYNRKYRQYDKNVYNGYLKKGAGIFIPEEDGAVQVELTAKKSKLKTWLSSKNLSW